MSRRRRHGRRWRDDAPSSTPESRLLERLATINNSIWFDPAYAPGVVTQLDGATLRVTSIQSRPIAAFTQYTVSQGTLSVAPAAATSPAGKQVLSFSAAQYLTGAAGLATLIQGSASYSTVAHASFAAGATRIRLCFCLGAGAPDNRVNHYAANVGSLNSLQRVQAGAGTIVQGSAIAGGAGTIHRLSDTYNGSDHDAWLDGAAEPLAPASGADTRAPASLDEMVWGAQRSAGAYASFWSGIQAGLVICPGTVLSAADRIGLETDLGLYYGY